MRGTVMDFFWCFFLLLKCSHHILCQHVFTWTSESHVVSKITCQQATSHNHVQIIVQHVRQLNNSLTCTTFYFPGIFFSSTRRRFFVPLYSYQIDHQCVNNVICLFIDLCIIKAPAKFTYKCNQIHYHGNETVNVITLQSIQFILDTSTTKLNWNNRIIAMGTADLILTSTGSHGYSRLSNNICTLREIAIWPRVWITSGLLHCM